MARDLSEEPAFRENAVFQIRTFENGYNFGRVSVSLVLGCRVLMRARALAQQSHAHACVSTVFVCAQARERTNTYIQ